LVNMPPQRSLYEALKTRPSVFDPSEIMDQFAKIDKKRVNDIARVIGRYIEINLPGAFCKRNELCDYRTNPYVLMTTANIMDLSDPNRFADFLFNSKLFMALETSFGKSIESSFLNPYPVISTNKWTDPSEKIAEHKALEGLSRQAKAQKRVNSVWREIDKSVSIGSRRYLVSIKSGPNTINDTQVQAMTDAIKHRHQTWLAQTKASDNSINEIDIVIGLTYGTDKTTNNKENQILAKLLDNGFIEENRNQCPGVIIDEETQSVRVYRSIGRNFWAFIGNPQEPKVTDFIYLEILLGLAKALSQGIESGNIEDRINDRICKLATALSRLQLPKNSLPDWVTDDFSESELFWFTTAMTAFFDEGI